MSALGKRQVEQGIEQRYDRTDVGAGAMQLVADRFVGALLQRV